MTDTTTSTEAAHMAPRFGSPFFTDADDESGIEACVVRRAPMTDAELYIFEAELYAKWEARNN